jgi:hypothetical protein
VCEVKEEKWACPIIDIDTVELRGTKLRTFPPLVLGGIIENQNSDFVMQY